MSIQITHVRFGSTPKTEETIVRYRWIEEGTGKIGDNDKPTLVDWVERGNKASVGSGTNRVAVAVVDASPKYLRTHADGQWNNNLRNLGEF